MGTPEEYTDERIQGFPFVLVRKMRSSVRGSVLQSETIMYTPTATASRTVPVMRNGSHCVPAPNVSTSPPQKSNRVCRRTQIQMFAVR